MTWCCRAVQEGGYARGALTAAVLLRSSVLAALVLHRHAQQWVSSLPRPLRSGAAPGCQCMAFFPPPGFDTDLRRDTRRLPGLAWWQRLLAGLLRLAGLHPAVLAAWLRSKRSTKSRQSDMGELSEMQSGTPTPWVCR